MWYAPSPKQAESTSTHFLSLIVYKWSFCPAHNVCLETKITKQVEFSVFLSLVLTLNEAWLVVEAPCACERAIDDKQVEGRQIWSDAQQQRRERGTGWAAAHWITHRRIHTQAPWPAEQLGGLCVCQCLRAFSLNACVCLCTCRTVCFCVILCHCVVRLCKYVRVFCHLFRQTAYVSTSSSSSSGWESGGGGGSGREKAIRWRRKRQMRRLIRWREMTETERKERTMEILGQGEKEEEMERRRRGLTCSHRERSFIIHLHGKRSFTYWPPMAALNGVLAPPPLAVSQWTPLWSLVQLARFFFTLETVETLTEEEKPTLFSSVTALLTLFHWCEIV